MHQKHCGGAVGHFLEVACGPARHAALLAKATGAAATGLDLSPGMLDYARQQADAAGVGDRLTLLQADMAQGAPARRLRSCLQRHVQLTWVMVHPAMACRLPALLNCAQRGGRSS